MLALCALAAVLAVSWSVQALLEGGEPAVAAPRAAHSVLIHAGGPALTPRGVQAMLRQAGWPDDEIGPAMRVSGCESGWRPKAVGQVGELGLFQVHPVNEWRFEARFGAHADPFDPVQNATVALDIYRAEGWGPWSCGYQALGADTAAYSAR